MSMKVGDTWPQGLRMVGGVILNERQRIWSSSTRHIAFKVTARAGACGSDGKPIINILDILNGVWI